MTDITNIDRLCEGFGPEDQSRIREAWMIACKVLKGRFRGRESDGCPFITHPENVGLIAKEEIGLGAECIVAVFLHESQRFNPSLPFDEKLWSRDVLGIVANLCKISEIKPKDTRLEAENYKKLIASYSADPRVIVLKIADRLEVMRNLRLFTKLQAERKVLETYLLYIPIAHQLGLYNIKSELEDICFRVSNPAEYKYINAKLKAGSRQREKLMYQFIEPLKHAIEDKGIKYKLKMRTKTAYSIYRKMQKQKVDFDGVFDVFAIRFIIDAPADDHKRELALCWDVFSLVTEKYEQDTSRLRDWLTNPKPNGYESLHITVRNEQGTPLEVQIRTTRMDDIAESGLASHWSYKGIKKESTLSGWLESVRKALKNPLEARYTDAGDISKSEIFVFTPSGELRRLPSGATLLDFAFEIHTSLGCTCTGGKVNGKAVSIKEVLKTGDNVEIQTSKTQKPRENWLSFVVSSKARTKIRQSIAKEEFDKAAEGRETLDRRLKNWKLTLSDEMLQDILKYRGLKTINAFHAAIAEGSIDVMDIKKWIVEGLPKASQEEDQTPVREKWTEKNAASASKSDIIFKDANIKNLDYKMALCCNPVYGDDVVGFVTRLDGIKIHRRACPNAVKMAEQYPYRMLEVAWNSNAASGSFTASLKISTRITPSAINEVMSSITQFKATIRSFSFSENAKDATYEIESRIAVASTLEIDKIISSIKKLKCTIKAGRN